MISQLLPSQIIFMNYFIEIVMITAASVLLGMDMITFVKVT